MRISPARTGLPWGGHSAFQRPATDWTVNPREDSRAIACARDTHTTDEWQRVRRNSHSSDPDNDLWCGTIHQSSISWPARLGSVLQTKPRLRITAAHSAVVTTQPESCKAKPASRPQPHQGCVRKAGVVSTTSAAINGLAVDGKRSIDACWLTPDSLAITCGLYIPPHLLETLAGNWWPRCFACIMCQRRCWGCWSWHTYGTHCRDWRVVHHTAASISVAGLENLRYLRNSRLHIMNSMRLNRNERTRLRAASSHTCMLVPRYGNAGRGVQYSDSKNSQITIFPCRVPLPFRLAVTDKITTGCWSCSATN
jgi:hypothetical protein